jgi:cytochrome c oxidase assembly protein subunit 15
MVIPTFPLSTPDGHLLPAYWDYRVVLQMAHRLMAVFIGVAIAVYGHYLWRDKGLHVLVRAASFVLLALVAVQIFLGAKIIWTGRSVTMTTGHVVFGALTLATTFAVVFITQRSMIERPVR